MKFDPVLDILYRKKHQLDSFFSPKTIAVIGATERENSVGRTIFTNLLKSNKKRTIIPINPKRDEVLGVKAYKAVIDVKEDIDLAVVVTPAKTVADVIKSCCEKKIPSAVIISAGFKELGKSGVELEQKILSIAKKGNLRIIGPNCLGIMNPHTKLNATFAQDIALKGNIAFISQSGALCTAVLDWSLKEKVGFSSFVSIGSMVDVDWGDLISYFGDDPNTKSILIYMESIGDPRSFLSAAREVSISKPIILIKAGVSEESAQAAASHTGALAGSNDVFNAALRRIGVLRVDSIEDLFSMAEILSKQPHPKGPKLTIVTNAGGPGVIATDCLIQNNGKLTKLEDSTHKELDKILPKEWSHSNPVDILGDASPELYSDTIKIISNDKNSDGILVILTPQYMTNPTMTAKMLSKFSQLQNKPILASWMGARAVDEGRKILTENKIPDFLFPEQACKAFTNMWAYSYNLEGIYEIPEMYHFEAVKTKKAKEKIGEIFDEVREDNRVILTEVESKEVLKAFGIPIVETFFAKTVDEAVDIAKKIGFPVVLKICSKSITHKSDIGGVKLNINNEDSVKKAFLEIKNATNEKDFDGVSVQKMIKLDGYELIIGSSIDSEFGPTILFGSGGVLVEVIKDSSLALPPLTSVLARRLMQQTKIYDALKGVRGKKSVDLSELEKILVRFSSLIAEYPEIIECDINPVIASPDGIFALDARVVITKKGEELPKLAIRPYPLSYVGKEKLSSGKEVVFRPIRPEDAPLVKEFIKDLSDETMLQKYLETFCYDELLNKDRIIYFCFNDYDREIAMVCKLTHPSGEKEIMAIGRLTKLPGEKKASFALVVKDKYQRQKIGYLLLSKLLGIAKNEHVEEVVAHTLKENKAIQKLCEKLGFKITWDKESSLILLDKKI